MDSVQRTFIKKWFPVYDGKCLSRKAVHNWVKKFFQRRSKVAGDARPGAEMAETVKRLVCSEFLRTGKAMGHAYQCWWRICREIHVFSRFEYHIHISIYLFTDASSYLSLQYVVEAKPVV
jgi:hypothetical protein